MARKTAKYAFTCMGLVLLVYVGSRILVPNMIVPSPFALEFTNDRIKSYVAALRREPKASDGILRCSERIRVQFPIEDQWGTLLRCRGKGRGIVIQSAGPDKIFDTKDDITKDVDTE